jgi:hypothetical protein
MLNRKEINRLREFLSQEVVESDFKTVKEMIRDGDFDLVGFRVSKKGTELVRVVLGNVSKEYPVNHIDATTWFNK